LKSYGIFIPASLSKPKINSKDTFKVGKGAEISLKKYLKPESYGNSDLRTGINQRSMELVD
jgi:hypothetical protein